MIVSVSLHKSTSSLGALTGAVCESQRFDRSFRCSEDVEGQMDVRECSSRPGAVLGRSHRHLIG